MMRNKKGLIVEKDFNVEFALLSRDVKFASFLQSFCINDFRRR